MGGTSFVHRSAIGLTRTPPCLDEALLSGEAELGLDCAPALNTTHACLAQSTGELLKDSWIRRVVKNTFIHITLDSPTSLAGNSARWRSRSVPKDMGAHADTLVESP